MKNALLIHPKTAGSAVGSGLAAVILWILVLCGVDVSTPEAVAGVAALASGLSWLAPILQSEFAREVPVTTLNVTALSASPGTLGKPLTVKPVATKKPPAK